jgi:hypothetical protein
LKPQFVYSQYGTAEAVPLQESEFFAAGEAVRLGGA